MLDKSALITAFYKVAFNKAPDAEGLAYWINDLNNGQTVHQVAHSFGAFLPQFLPNNITNVINEFSFNAYGHAARLDVQNHWTILAMDAVPSYALMEEMALTLVGQPTDFWANPVQ